MALHRSESMFSVKGMKSEDRCEYRETGRKGHGEITELSSRTFARPKLDKSHSCPSGSSSPSSPPVVQWFPQNRVTCGKVAATPIRLLTEGGLTGLFAVLQGDLDNTAVVFDFDKVLVNDPGEDFATAGSAKEDISSLIRGGMGTVELIRSLHRAGVPLFVATARKADRLPHLHSLIIDREEFGFTEYFFKNDRDPACENIIIDRHHNPDIGFSFLNIRGTRIFSAGLDKSKIVAHIASSELQGTRKRIVFVDDNVFNAYFVLQEVPEILRGSIPGENFEILSSWWDPSFEQNRGRMRIFLDSDFSYTKEYQECLTAFGVSEVERVFTAGKLVAKSLLRGEDVELYDKK